MRILVQMDSPTRPRSSGALRSLLLLAIAGLGWSGVAEAQAAEIRCAVTENGAPARGTVLIQQAGREVGGGSCGPLVSVPAGKCKVTVWLDGTLDNPSKSVEIDAKAGAVRPVSIDFQTGVLEVRIETEGQRGTGMVTVVRGSRRIGTLGSGVAARLSAGRYEIIVRLGGEERRYDVDLRPGQRRLVRAQF